MDGNSGQNPFSDDPLDPNPSERPKEGGSVNDAGTYSQRLSHNPVAARVPERVAKGVLSTGVVVLDSPTEFVIDFLHGLTRPAHVAARVVLAPATMNNFVNAVRDNLGKFSQTFGQPAALPKPPPHRPTIQEIYENFKLPDEQMSGTYANGVMIGHSATEFFFDFITGFYPTAAVSARVFLAAPQMPRVLDAIANAQRQWEQRYRQQSGSGPAAPPPGEGLG